MKKYTTEQRQAVNTKRTDFMAKARAMSTEGVKVNETMNQEGRLYSLFNQYLIAVQEGKAGMYAGFGNWKMKGRSVKKGSSGFVICCPLAIQDKDTKESEIKGFTYKSIFHIDDTELITA